MRRGTPAAKDSDIFLRSSIPLCSFPALRVPNVSVLPHILVESIIIAVVGYCITLSMAKIFAAKFGYRVDGNQEMFGEVL